MAFKPDRIIEMLAAAFAEQIDFINRYPPKKRAAYLAMVRDDIIAVANVLHERFPYFNGDEFFTAANYTGIHPILSTNK